MVSPCVRSVCVYLKAWTMPLRKVSILRLFTGLDSARVLGVEPLLTADDIAEEDGEHLGVMSYAARFLNLKPQAMSAFTKYEPDKVQASHIV